MLRDADIITMRKSYKNNTLKKNIMNRTNAGA
jgi:hypothetical protein